MGWGREGDVKKSQRVREERSLEEERGEAGGSHNSRLSHSLCQCCWWEGEEEEGRSGRGQRGSAALTSMTSRGPRDPGSPVTAHGGQERDEF